MYDSMREFLLDETLDEIIRDEMSVSTFAIDMKQKLMIARAKGRTGWYDQETCTDEHLANLFQEHLRKCDDGNFIDLANFLMFLHVRGAKPDVLKNPEILESK